MFQTGEIRELNDEVYPHGQGEIWLNTRLIPLKNARGQVTKVMSVSHDITTRKQAEAALQEPAVAERSPRRARTSNPTENRRVDSGQRAASSHLRRHCRRTYDHGRRKQTLRPRQRTAVPDARICGGRAARAGPCRHPPSRGSARRFSEVPGDCGRACQHPARAPVVRRDGSIFWADIMGHGIVYEGRPCVLALFRDVTDRRRARQAMEREYRTLKHLLQSSDHKHQLIAYEIHDGVAQHRPGRLCSLKPISTARKRTPERRQWPTRPE